MLAFNQKWITWLSINFHALYCSYKLNILKLEMVQRRAASFVLNDFFKYSSISRMLEQLGWPMLKQWRNKVKVILMHKMLHINNSVFNEFKLEYNTNHTRDHSVTLSSKIIVYPDSFFPSAIILWSNLSAEVVTSRNLETFKKNCSSYFYNWLCVIFSYQNMYIFLGAVH